MIWATTTAGVWINSSEKRSGGLVRVRAEFATAIDAFGETLLYGQCSSVHPLSAQGSDAKKEKARSLKTARLSANGRR